MWNKGCCYQPAFFNDGIGIKKAEAIVTYRKEHGKFKNLEDLQMVKGIGTKTVEKNKNEIQF